MIEHFDDRGAIIGGIAASLLGKPRLTADIDVVILLSIEDLGDLIQKASDLGIASRIDDAEAFAKKNRVLLARHQASSINIDISLGILPFEVEMVERSHVRIIGELHLRLPSPEDLIILKAVAHRPQDLEDIKGIAASHRDINRDRIEYWIKEFGTALDTPDLWEEISKML